MGIMLMLSKEEKKACAELFYAFTGERIMATRWNKKAALELYQMITNLKKCTTGLSFIINLPKVPPHNPKSALRKVGKYILKILWQKAEMEKEQGKAINPRCAEWHTGPFVRNIKGIIIGF